MFTHKKFQTWSKAKTRIPRTAILIVVVVAILGGMLATSVNDAVAKSNDPAECHNPRNGSKVYGSAASNGKSNTAVLRYDIGCDLVWVKIVQNVAENNYAFVVGYTCQQAKAACRGDSTGLKLKKGNRYSYGISLSDHVAFRLCWSPKVTTGPFKYCTSPVKLGSRSNNTSATPNGDMNVRSGPGVSYSKVGVVKAGTTTTVQCQTKVGSTPWYKIGDQRWMSGKHVLAKPSVATCSATATSRLTATITMDTTRKGHGTITINDTTYKFNSGTTSLWSTPIDTFKVTTHYDERYENSFSVRDGNGDGKRFGYSFALTSTTSPFGEGTGLDERVSRPDCESAKAIWHQNRCYRTLLRIHPDGGVPGTAGCIGILGGEKTQRSFRDDMNALINRTGSVELTVRR